MIDLFHIASYYFKLTIKVERISPKSQTILKNPPTNIEIAGLAQRVNI